MCKNKSKSPSGMIYIVEPDETLNKPLQRLIRSIGYDVESFHSSEAFINSDRLEYPSCLIIDVLVARERGFEFFRKLSNKIPVIFTTVEDHPRELDMLNENDAITFLEKPFNNQVLVHSIKLAFNQQCHE